MGSWKAEVGDPPLINLQHNSEEGWSHSKRLCQSGRVNVPWIMSTEANCLPNMPTTEDLQYKPNVLCFLKESLCQIALLQTNWLKLKIKLIRNFLRGPVVKISPCSAGDVGLIPGRGTNIPYSEGGQPSPWHSSEPVRRGAAAPAHRN